VNDSIFWFMYRKLKGFVKYFGIFIVYYKYSLTNFMREVYLPSLESTNITVTIRIKKIYLFMLIID